MAITMNSSTPAVPPRNVVMLCTGARGGMRSVIESYANAGLFARWNVRLLYSHVDGGAARRGGAGVLALLRFVTLLARGRVGLLHAHAATGLSFWRKAVFAALARTAGAPVVWHVHGAEMHRFYAAHGTRGRARIRHQLEAAARVVVLSRSWRDFVQDIAPRARVEIVVNHVQLPPVQDCRRPHAGLTVLFLGMLGQRKGIYDLLPAFKGVAQHVDGVRLLVGGNGEVEQTAQMVRELGLTDTVEVLGWVSGEAKRALLAQADVFVLPSYNEGLPVSVLEAMSYGVPVISTRVGGIPELVREGVDGYLIDAGDRAALEDRMLRLVGDAALRRAMGDAARARIEAEYSEAAVLPVLEAMYAQVLDASAQVSDGPAKREPTAPQSVAQQPERRT